MEERFVFSSWLWWVLIDLLRLNDLYIIFTLNLTLFLHLLNFVNVLRTIFHKMEWIELYEGCLLFCALTY